MKALLARFRSAPRLSRWDLLFTVFPLFLWWFLLSLRPVLLHPWCNTAPERCTAAAVAPIDRVALQWESGTADGFSFLAQNSSGAIGFAAPLALQIGRIALRTALPGAALAELAIDWVLLIETTAWNGVGIELSHEIFQRPRPFVYSDPFKRGQDPAHYVAFYSGHTSFVAAIWLGLFLVLLSRRAPRPFIWVVAGLGPLVVIFTGICRVLAGRHFPTDTLAAALAGSTIAYLVALLHRRPWQEPKQK